MPDSHKNFIFSTVATAPSPATSGTSLVVAAGYGANLPTAPFNMTVWPANAQPSLTNAEIVRVTARSTDTLTITRAQEGTTARSIVVGDQIALTITAKTLTDIENAMMTKSMYDPQNAGYISGAQGSGGGTAVGGTLKMDGGTAASKVGGNIDTSGAAASGGNINTSNGGGSIDTRGTGSIELGVAATRTTIVGSATAARTQTLPDKDGTFAMTNDIPGSAWVNFNGTVSANQSGTYSRTGTTVTVTMTAHGHIVGHVVQISFTSGGALSGTYTITGVTANTYTVTTAASGTIAAGSTMLENRRSIRASSNVHDVAYVSTGHVRVNFTAALADANYVTIGKYISTGGAWVDALCPYYIAAPTAQSAQVSNFTSAGAGLDATYCMLQFVR